MHGYVLDLHDINRAHSAVVGGKAAHLAALSRIEGIRVPEGFCVTTEAFQRMLAEAPFIESSLDGLSGVEPDDLDALHAISAEIRRIIETTPIPDDLAEAMTGPLARYDERVAWAVRSSATAEDLPTASFAGQQDTYLNVIGAAAILEHVRRCWASLFSDRAVTYRHRNSFDHRKVRMAVIVQRMVVPDSAGVLFTADPVTGNRKVTSVEAVFGLGEALVSGRVDADVFRVRGDAIVARTIARKQFAIELSPGGGTQECAIHPAAQQRPALTDAQVQQLVELGWRIEAHFGCPQDIEWCLVDGEFHIVQSRPITTLFPIPAAGDGENRVYVSVGHQQMMTDAMKPLGISFWQLTAGRPMYDAGGRLFVDVTRNLASPRGRAALFEMLGKSDPLIGDALRTIVERGDFIQPLAAGDGAPPLAGGTPAEIETDPAIVEALIARWEASLAALKRNIRGKSGPALLDFILADIQELRQLLFDPQSTQAIMAGMQATWWLNEKLHAWLGEKNAADILAQSAPNNVTSEMGLALLDVADAIRPHPDVIVFLQNVAHADFLQELPRLPGGRESLDAIRAFLDRYGMRCVGEIDITRPRWSERPATLVPIILANIRNFEPGAGRRRFEQGLRESQQKEQELLTRLRALPDGEQKAEEAKRAIDRLRTFIGYREYPKYGMVSRYFVYKQALLAEADRLVHDRALHEREDVFYLTFHELHELVRTRQVDDQLIRQRKDAFRSYQSLTPPRVVTSDGEVVTGEYRRGDLPKNALVGLAVSAGVVEGRARVIVDISEADLEPGDILVTAFTDPSWTPLFVSIAGLVTEVGGLMTHGAVIAREYGLPAVVGVVDATKRIRDGQRIRVHGTDGFVEVLD